MAHQLLHYFRILCVGFEQGGIGVAKGLEADPLSDRGLLGYRLENAVQQRIRPRRHFVWGLCTSKDPILQLGIAGFALPTPAIHLENTSPAED